MFTCNICDKDFPLGNSQQMEVFVSHVSKCKLQVKTILKERFWCSVCRKRVTYKRSFRNHIAAFHLRNSANNQEFEAASSRTKIRRQKGTVSSRFFELDCTGGNGQTFAINVEIFLEIFRKNIYVTELQREKHVTKNMLQTKSDR